MKELKDMTLEELWQLFPIVLKEHNPDYRTWYLEEEKLLRQLLSGLNICRISHIGSTSVPDLIAKPIIDILLELPESGDFNRAINLLEQNGWITMLKKLPVNIYELNKGYTPEGFAPKVFHLHIRPSGDWGELYFRDYLRQHPEAARSYEELKQSLKNQYEHHRDAYTEAKSDFVNTCTDKARAEYRHRYQPQ